MLSLIPSFRYWFLNRKYFPSSHNINFHIIFSLQRWWTSLKRLKTYLNLIKQGNLWAVFSLFFLFIYLLATRFGSRECKLFYFNVMTLIFLHIFRDIFVFHMCLISAACYITLSQARNDLTLQYISTIL